MCGFLYGVPLGITVVTIGSLAGASVSFFVCRQVLSTWIEEKLTYKKQLFRVVSQKPLTDDFLRDSAISLTKSRHSGPSKNKHSNYVLWFVSHHYLSEYKTLFLLFQRWLFLNIL